MASTTGTTPGNSDAAAENLTLIRKNGTWAVCKLKPSCAEHVEVVTALLTEAAGDATQTVFAAMTPTELSVVVGTDKVRRIHAATCAQAEVTVDDGWACFVVEGAMAFNIVGVMAKLSSCLAAARVSLLAQSTFDTDYIFVKEDKVQAAETAFTDSGIVVNRQ